MELKNLKVTGAAEEEAECVPIWLETSAEEITVEIERFEGIGGLGYCLEQEIGGYEIGGADL